MKVKVISVQEQDFNGTKMNRVNVLCADGSVGHVYSKEDIKAGQEITLVIYARNDGKFGVRPARQ
ncbi:hypothetical protein P0G10_06695 [Eubacteriales bacterium DFI.9.88]|nr:hypothetical protein [Eubacteriales bacterium DFI.9.88]